MRAKTPANAAHSLNAEYYRQRASEGGLIIAEGSQVTPAGQGNLQLPASTRMSRLKVGSA
jgi:2,4-dienoyl-CoA reductase-like NADH-dependent reductase (Old Yellow Enzyme family)